MLALAAASYGVSRLASGEDSSIRFSPAPGSRVASPQTQISIGGVEMAQSPRVTVTGSRSGEHRGKLVAHRTGAGVSFIPEQPFAPGEQVSVQLQAKQGAPGPPRHTEEWRVRFTIAKPASLAIQTWPPGKPTRADQVQSFHSRPDLHPPTVTVNKHSSNTARGDVFIGPGNQLGQAGPLILDGQGKTVWFRPLPGSTQAFGFREQHYDGKPVLTWWQGVVTAPGFGIGENLIYDTSYRHIATVKAANGYRADLHDFIITPQGTALILAYNPVHADLSSVGGPRDGVVIDGVVQEIDIKSGLVLFEWHSFDHVALDESQAKPAKGRFFDYFHINSVAVDRDGNLLVSARNTWAVYKIDRHTGTILWRLGGKRSSFEMSAGTQFAYQHDARRQPDGTITLFDNGAAPQVHPQTRTVALRADTHTMRATLVRQYTHSDKLLAGSQGNMQTLPNGDRFVGWGGLPRLTEFSPEGRVLFDASIASPSTSYRAYRFPWSATPSGKPAIATSTSLGGKITVYASWNGATEIARWRILAGSSPGALKPVAEVPRTGFETAATASTRGEYVAVQARDASGRALGTSQPVRTLP